MIRPSHSYLVIPSKNTIFNDKIYQIRYILSENNIPFYVRISQNVVFIMTRCQDYYLGVCNVQDWIWSNVSPTFE